MTPIEKILRLWETCSQPEREQLLVLLHQRMPPHPVERIFGAKADVILDAIRLSGELTQRMLRGVIAEAAFEVEVARKLAGWQARPRTGNPSYDFLLVDDQGEVRIQVKLQRSKNQQPWVKGQNRRFYVVETQKTRGGIKGGKKTRPYQYGEFDVLAVSMFPATRQWNTFMYTVGTWLQPSPEEPTNIAKHQPVAMKPNTDWTDEFQTVIRWFRRKTRKTITGEL